jgi:hypothetical protein
MFTTPTKGEGKVGEEREERVKNIIINVGYEVCYFRIFGF